jgi:hypothetical protein
MKAIKLFALLLLAVGCTSTDDVTKCDCEKITYKQSGYSSNPFIKMDSRPFDGCEPTNGIVHDYGIYFYEVKCN